MIESVASIGWGGLLWLMALLVVGLSGLVVAGPFPSTRREEAEPIAGVGIEEGALELARACLLRGEISPEAYQWVSKRLAE